MNKSDGQHVSLNEFLTKDLGSLIGRDLPMDVEKILGQVNGGSFMKCHTAIFEATGIWIDESGAGLPAVGRRASVSQTGGPTSRVAEGSTRRRRGGGFAQAQPRRCRPPTLTLGMKSHHGRAVAELDARQLLVRGRHGFR